MGYEKNDYHPQAEWANDNDHSSGAGGYAVPAGSPPAARSGFGGAGDRSANEAQDAAWMEAQRTGPTAHLMSPTSPRRSQAQGQPQSRDRVVRNDEEDEAWARAREEGVTAHLTGGGGKGGGVV